MYYRSECLPAYLLLLTTLLGCHESSSNHPARLDLEDQQIAPPERIQTQAANSRWGAFVAEVISVPEGTWTNGNPPVIEIKIVESLSGGHELGPVQYCWDVDGPFKGECGVGAEVQIANWSAAPIELPKTGSRWIIARDSVGPGFTTRLPDSEENRQQLVLQGEANTGS